MTKYMKLKSLRSQPEEVKKEEDDKVVIKEDYTLNSFVYDLIERTSKNELEWVLLEDSSYHLELNGFKYILVRNKSNGFHFEVYNMNGGILLFSDTSPNYVELFVVIREYMQNSFNFVGR